MLVVTWRTPKASRAALLAAGLLAGAAVPEVVAPPPPPPDATALLVITWTTPRASPASLRAAFGNTTGDVPAGAPGALVGTASITLDATGELAAPTGAAAGDATALLVVTWATPRASRAALRAAWGNTRGDPVAPDAALVGTASITLDATGELSFAPYPDATAITVIRWRTPKASRAALRAAWGNTQVEAIPLAPAALVGTASITLDATGALTTAIALTGTAAVTLDADGALTTQIQLGGTAALTLDATGALATAIALAGTAALTLDASGDLPAAAVTELIGTAALTLDATGSLTTAIRLTGTAALTLDATGDLAGGVPLLLDVAEFLAEPRIIILTSDPTTVLIAQADGRVVQLRVELPVAEMVGTVPAAILTVGEG